MAFNAQKLALIKPRAKSCYERWIESEGVSVVEGFGVSDVRHLSLSRWHRLGCDGAYLRLHGIDGSTGAYVGRIAPGTTTEPERHLYEKVIYIIHGEGVAEFQQRGRVPQSIAWKAGSLFAPPLNATHRLINHGKEPALFLAVTTAPMILDHFHNEQFIFQSDFAFVERYDGEDGYFDDNGRRYLAGNGRQWIWETNFISDACKVALDAQRQKRAGVHATQFEIADNTLVGELGESPVGRSYPAQVRGGGAVIVVLRSEGYSLIWPKHAGRRPYENGCGDRVVRINWQSGSIFSPPAGWFHQHFNTGPSAALYLSLRCDSQKFPLGARVAPLRMAVYTSVEAEGMAGEPDRSDREIQRLYGAELARRGIALDADYAAAANQD